jgi:hypothetical protein
MRTTSFNIHGLLALQIASRRDSAHRFFNDELACFRVPSTNCPEVQVVVGSLPHLRSAALFLNNRKYTVSDDSISFDEWYKVFRLRLRLTGLQGPETTLHFDGHPLAYRLLFLKFIIPVLRLRLLQQNLTLVKASAVESEDGIWLLPAWSGGGKTSMVLHAVERGCSFWSDTFSLVSQEGKVYPLPRPLHLFWRNVATCPLLWARVSRKEQHALKLKHLLYVLSLRTLNLSHRWIMEDAAVGRSPQRLCSVLFLTETNEPFWRGERDLPPEQAAARMMANDRHEARLFDASYWAYIQSQSSGWGYWQTHLEVLTRALKGVDCNQVFLPYRPQPCDFERILDWQMA